MSDSAPSPRSPWKDPRQWKIAGAVFAVGFLAVIGTMAAGPKASTTSAPHATTAVADDWVGSPEPGTDRDTLCKDQENLLAHYVDNGDVKKMEQYQRYLTQNRCYG